MTLRSPSLFVLAFCLGLPSSATGTDETIGHRVSISRYGFPSVGKAFKLTAKAGTEGNGPAFVLPTNPVGATNLLTIVRDGGSLFDPLTAGTWKGLGQPPGAKGWRYKNGNADAAAPVKVIVVKPKLVKISTVGTGSMPVPLPANGDLRLVLRIDDRRYCTDARAPHAAEFPARMVKSRKQFPPAECGSECPLGTDTDGDRLDDCFETNTGVFVDAFDTGTDPTNSDTDDDGINDGDEVLGSSAGLNLPAFGVSPLRKDVLVEYDWFDDSISCGAHSHRPPSAVFAAVTAAFAGSPVGNPDGSTGINFVHDYGQGGVFTGGNFINDADGVLSGGVFSAEFQDHRAANFDPLRRGYFHYTILPHRYGATSSSGQAEFPGDDMIVSLGCALVDQFVANTIVHEIGHNFALGHGGNNSCNYKPNYNSVMNYRYQFPGVDNDCTPGANGVLDYSHGDRIPLDENALDENSGICGAPPVDWNNDSLIEAGVVFDVNSADEFQSVFCGGTLSTLTDNDDWSAIRLDFVSLGARLFAPTSTIDCTNVPPGF